MNKEQVLALISEAMDRGASISVHVTQSNQGMEKHTLEQAEDYINRFQEAIGSGKIEHSKHPDLEIESLITNHNGIRACFSYHPYMVEDIQFHEEGEVESA